MSTDRELLEAAARAAAKVGIKVSWRESAGCFCYSGSPYHIAWNPLTDDGDALRLAVALSITVIPGHSSEPYSVAQWWRPPTLIELDFERVLVEGDRNAATRRAIVRAAAAIAQEPPCP